jgi:hypothetical protein
MKSKLLLFGIMIAIAVSCSKDDTNNGNQPQVYSLSGKVQKGPFIAGTIVTLNELNNNLNQTGKSFTTSITDDIGSFELLNLELGSGLVMLTANGFYFSELYGTLSSGSLSLQTIADLDGNETLNINILTHLVKGRTEKLVSEGANFQQASSQAKNELLAFLGVDDPLDLGFENLDISKQEDENAILLAFSIIAQRYTNYANQWPTLIAELTELLSNLSTHFKENGEITDQALIDKLLLNVSQLHLIDIRNHIEQRYADLGQTVTIPNFEKYVGKFQEKHSSIFYTDFIYPDSASPDPVNFPDGKVENLLVKEKTSFQSGPYVIAAIAPLNSTLTIKFIPIGTTNYAFGGINIGWEVISHYPNGFTFISQIQNVPIAALFNLEFSGSATIEYYEDGPDIPTFVKTITWD